MSSETPSLHDLTSTAFSIICVRSELDLRDAKDLFYKYAESIGIDLQFQKFDHEMDAMPGKYAPPTGELLLARDLAGMPIGCVALRPLSDVCCEMKRLYVLPTAQGTGLGRALATSIIRKAVEIGYSEMRLDTLPFMEAAIKMYRKFGFVDIPAYYDTPMESTVFLSLKLPRENKSVEGS